MDDVSKIVEAVRNYESYQDIVDLIKKENWKASTGSPSFKKNDMHIEFPNSYTTKRVIEHESRISSQDVTMDIQNVVNINVLSLPAKPWTEVTDDSEIISHLIMLYFAWDRPFCYIVEKTSFVQDMLSGNTKSTFCSPLLVNAILAQGCVRNSSFDLDCQ